MAIKIIKTEVLPRLYLLRDKTIPLMRAHEKNFDMGSFFSVPYNLQKADEQPDSMACGTTLCALGFAACTPEFIADGLKWVWVDGEPHNVSRYDLMRPLEHKTLDADAEYFGLDVVQEQILFYTTSVRDGEHRLFNSEKINDAERTGRPVTIDHFAHRLDVVIAEIEAQPEEYTIHELD